MSNKVQLYAYDLSNGMAKQMSLQLTGRQIDGIWHTSVVVYGKEIFYGQGISITPPGRSHHGAPLHVYDMGETAIDEDTFNEYLSEMRQQYTADKYHLLDFNCNSFTNDCIGFLTGGSIPSHIKDLPSDFMSTPFGAALRPTIDAMFRPQAAGVSRTIPREAVQQAAQASPNPALASSILQSVASMATQSGASSSAPATGASTVSAPMQICTNASSFASLLSKHRVLVGFFTSSTCPPCRVIEPVFERLAEEKTRGRSGSDLPAFVKVSIDAPSSSQLASQYAVRVTPTFIFFLDGKKTAEMKGADASELRTQVDLLLYQAFPPHPHTRLALPAVEALSSNPILFSQFPPLTTVLTKFSDAITTTSAPEGFNKDQLISTLSKSVLPYLTGLEACRSGKAKTISPAATPAMLSSWAQATRSITTALPTAQLFPLVDMWRLAMLDPVAANWLGTTLATAAPNPLFAILTQACDALSSTSAQAPTRNTVLVTLRLLANALGAPTLSTALCAMPAARTQVLEVLVPSLLHDDAQVRTAAASAVFNVAAALQRRRVDRVKAGRSDAVRDELDGEWEVELASAIVEAIQREVNSEDVVHRLTASLAYLLRLSPIYEEELSSLLEVLQAKDTLKSKVSDGPVKKADVKKLVEEVANKLCP